MRTLILSISAIIVAILAAGFTAHSSAADSAALPLKPATAPRQEPTGGVVDFAPSAQDLGEGWTRTIDFVLDDASKPAEYPLSMPQEIIATQRTNALKAGRLGSMLLSYRNTEFPQKAVDVGISRYEDTNSVNRQWQELLASPIQHKPIDNLGERALVFGEIFQIAPPQGNPPTVWLARSNIVVWITLFCSPQNRPDLEIPRMIDEKIKEVISRRNAKLDAEPKRNSPANP